MTSTRANRPGSFPLLLLSITAFALSAHTFFITAGSGSLGYTRPEELLRAVTLRESSSYGSGYEVALRRSSRDEAAHSLRIEKIAEQNGLALGFVSYRLEGREWRECHWMKRHRNKWYPAYVALYKRGSVPAEQVEWFSQVSGEASAWIQSANTPSAGEVQTTTDSSS